MKEKLFITFNINKKNLQISSILKTNNNFIKHQKDQVNTFENLEELNNFIYTYTHSLSNKEYNDLFINFIFEDNFFNKIYFQKQELSFTTYEEFLLKNKNSIVKNNNSWTLNSDIYKFKLTNNGTSKTYNQFPENTDYEYLNVFSSSLNVDRSEEIDKFFLKLVADLDEIKKKMSCSVRIVTASQVLASEYKNENTHYLLELNDEYISVNIVRNGVILYNEYINLPFQDILELIAKKFQIKTCEAKYRVKYILNEIISSNSTSYTSDEINLNIKKILLNIQKKLTDKVDETIIKLKDEFNLNEVKFVLNENKFNFLLSKILERKYAKLNFKVSVKEVEANQSLNLIKFIDHKVISLIKLIDEIGQNQSISSKTITTEIVVNKVIDKKSPSNIFWNFLSNIFGLKKVF